MYTLVSPAKINLYLNITGKDRKDGYHNIVSVIERISLCDRIYVKPSRDGFSIKVKGLRVVNDRRNSIHKTYELFRNRFGIKSGFQVLLEKNIPVGGGLGGHSSNAAVFASFLNRYCKLNLSLEELADTVSQISKDASFFAYDTSFALVEGKGEVVKPLDIKGRFKHMIWVYPRGLSTKSVYGHYRQGLTTFLDNVNIIVNALKNKDMVLLKAGIYNALEKPASQIFPQLFKIKEFLFDNGIEIAGMSGSGPTVFCMGKKFPNLPGRWGRWHCLGAKTF